jgi:DNA repair ATPase RecN
MLTRIDIADFQSLRKATIPVGRLSVVTGPSNSGKSALRRAAELVARNARGTGYIRRGASRCAVVLTFAEAGREYRVAIRRTATGRGGDMHRISADGAGPQEYTKLGGQVPEDVARLLRLGPLNFFGQHDGPYLLGSSGTEVAQVLGDLTNVSLVFRAAQEAGRRRKGFDRDIKTAAARLEALRGQEDEFEGLDDQLAALGKAEAAAAVLAQDEARLARLADLIARLEDAEQAQVQAAKALAAAEPPDLTRLDRGLARYKRLGALISELEAAEGAVRRWGGEAGQAAEREAGAHRALHDALAAAGQCPLCGQAVAA